ncbi:MAG: calcium:proton antiporter [Propionibacterium sp.]|nr:calcium:proton antiporter [Propionibacterium sp.]
MTVTARSVLTRRALARLLLGWGTVVAMLLLRPLLAPPVQAGILVLALAAIIGVILVCAFGVVREAEHLAHRLGDPYGSLVLTISIVLIEVILIAAVMMGPGDTPTIARDSVMAVSMIILNLVIGLSLLVGGLKHGGMTHNRTGTSAYFSMLVVLCSLAFALPAVIGDGGTYTPGQAVPIVVLTIGLYVFFLWQQMGRHAGDFREVLPPAPRPDLEEVVADAERPSVVAIFHEHRPEILTRVMLLVVTVLPIVLLSQDMAVLLDDGLGRLGAPVALAGVLIAMIVFLPESITSVRAALGGEIQRVSNLCHGALVSTVGITIPVTLSIGFFTDRTVVLAESPTNLLMLGATLLLTVATFGGKRVGAMHGAAHLVVFAIYGITIFS